MSLHKFLKHLNKNKLPLRRKDVAGKLIDYGVHRDVYECKVDSRFVVKIERDMSTGDFANVCEWRNWINNKDWKDLAKWLAPCEIISEDGKLLIQRRVNFYKNRKYPERIPTIFTDLKKENYGWIGKQLVCVDYAFFRMDFNDLRLRKVAWWTIKYDEKSAKYKKVKLINQ